jgi:uncharacterized protein YkwD
MQDPVLLNGIFLFYENMARLLSLRSIMRYYKIAVLLCSFFFAGIFTVHAQQRVEEEILELVNRHRGENQLQPLEMNEKISKAAQKHSKNMAAGKIPLGHSGFDKRMDDVADDLNSAKAFAENVAYGKTTAVGFVEMWLESPGHKKNIEGNYNLTGIGIAKAKNGKLYVTQIFIHRK